VLVVSHDRYFVDRVCDKVVALLGDGALAELPGGVDEYLARRAAGGAPLTTAAGGAPLTTAAGAESRAVGAPSTSAPAVSAADARAAKKEASRLERRMLKLDADEKKLHAQLAAAAADYAKAAELDAQLKAVHAEKEQVEEEWLAASELAEG
jgi:ATP-binding cassette subfamily F protein uup